MKTLFHAIEFICEAAALGGAEAACGGWAAALGGGAAALGWAAALGGAAALRRAAALKNPGDAPAVRRALYCSILILFIFYFSC